MRQTHMLGSLAVIAAAELLIITAIVGRAKGWW